MFSPVKYELSTIILFVGIGYSLRVRQLLTSDSRSRKLAICVRYGKWCQRFCCHQLAFAICEFCLNDLLDGHNVKFLLFPYFLFFWFSYVILSYACFYPNRSFKPQQLIVSQIRSHIEYLFLTYYILLLTCSFNDDSWLRFWATLYCQIKQHCVCLSVFIIWG